MSKKKRKKNNKRNGFTMIEVLAVVTILGIISVIGIVAVNGLIKKGNENYYVTQKKELINATKSYLQKNQGLYPREGETTSISLGTLQDNNYIGEFVDNAKQPCDRTNTVVEVSFVEKGQARKMSAFIFSSSVALRSSQFPFACLLTSIK